MLESDTYLAILDEGALKHARKMVLRWAKKSLVLPLTTWLQQ